MPAPLAIELRVEPSMERPLDQGFVLRLEIDEGVAATAAQLWVVHGDWMEQPETNQLRQLPASSLPREKANVIFASLSSVSLKAVPSAAMGFHATTYRLSVEVGFNCTSYRWWHELPPEWQALSPVISELVNLAHASAHSDA